MKKFIHEAFGNIKNSRLEREIDQRIRILGNRQEEADLEERKQFADFKPRMIACIQRQREIAGKDIEKERSDTIFRAYYRGSGIQDQLREFTVFVCDYMDCVDDFETVRCSVTGPINTAEHQLRTLREKLEELDTSIKAIESSLSAEPSNKDILGFYEKIEYKKPEYKQLLDELHHLQQRVKEGKADEQDTKRRLNLIDKKAKGIASFFHVNQKRLEEIENKLEINHPVTQIPRMDDEIDTGKKLLAEIVSLFDAGAALSGLVTASMIACRVDESLYDRQSLTTLAELVSRFLEKWSIPN